MDGSLSPPVVACKQCHDQNSPCTGDYPECTRCARLYLTCEYSPLPSQPHHPPPRDRHHYQLPPPSAIFHSVANPPHPSPSLIPDSTDPYSSGDKLPSLLPNHNDPRNSGYRSEQLPSLFSGSNGFQHTRSRQGTPPARYYSKGLINLSAYQSDQGNRSRNYPASRNSGNLSPSGTNPSLMYSNRKREMESSYTTGSGDRYSSGSPRRFKSSHDSIPTGAESQTYWPYPSQSGGLPCSLQMSPVSLPLTLSQLGNPPVSTTGRYSPPESQRDPLPFHSHPDRHNGGQTMVQPSVPPQLTKKPLTGQEHWVSEFRQFTHFSESSRAAQPSEITLPLPLNGISLTHAKTYGQMSSWPGFGIERSPRAGFMINRPKVVHEEFKRPTTHCQKAAPVLGPRLPHLARKFYSGNSNTVSTPRDAITSLVPPPLYPFPSRQSSVVTPYPKACPNLLEDKLPHTRSDLITRLTYNFSISELLPTATATPREKPPPTTTTTPITATPPPTFSSVSHPTAPPPPKEHTFSSVRAAKSYGPTVLPVHKECKS